MKITIEVIKHKDQRYNTIGDWQYDEDDNLNIRVSDLGNWRWNALIGLHEACEALCCKSDGITENEVDKFDMNWVGDPDQEPGDDPKAPYRKQHFFATNIERLLAQALGVDWGEYENFIYSL